MIFVDTGAFLARHLGRDQHHQAAKAAWAKLGATKEACGTSNFVLDELLTLLGRGAGYGFAAQRARSYYASSGLTILRPEEEDELEALDWFTKYQDQEVSFTDCVSFALMRRHRLSRVFSFDRHFQIAGFELWPR